MTTSAAEPANETPESTTARPLPAMDDLTAQLLNELQDHYPLVERPYAEIGDRLGISEQQTLERLREAREAGIVRQICAIYDTKALGYSSALVAMRVPADRLEQAAAVVGAVREAVGPRVELLIEVHRRLAPMNAIRVAKMIEQYRSYWFD